MTFSNLLGAGFCNFANLTFFGKNIKFKEDDVKPITHLSFEGKCEGVCFSCLGVPSHFAIFAIYCFVFLSVFDYSYRDYILSWYGQLSRDEGQLYQLLSEDFWEIAKQLRQRLSHVDVVKVVCNDVVKALLSHFCDLKGANAR